MLREFYLGFIKIHILHHATKEPIYGLWLIEELGRHGYNIGPATVYPTLHSMKEEGYLECYPVTINGKIRKYYKATSKGKQALDHSKEKIRELINEVL